MGSFETKIDRVSSTKTNGSAKRGASKVGSRLSDNGGGTSRSGPVVLIERRALLRDLFVRALGEAVNSDVVAFDTLEEFGARPDAEPICMMLLCHFGQSESSDIKDDLERLFSNGAVPFPVVIVSESTTNERVIQALEGGARGYIPSDMPLDVMAEVLRVISAGGTYVSASCLLGKNLVDEPARNESAVMPEMKVVTSKSIFTARQVAVVDAIIRGMANKAIARKLNMRESTVKVHVRNIMKKLDASNRTEVAFLASKMLDQ